MTRACRKAGSKKEERGCEYHKEKDRLTGPTGLSQRACDEARDKFSRPNTVQFCYATCPTQLILPSLMPQRSNQNQPIPYTHSSKLSPSRNVDFFSHSHVIVQIAHSSSDSSTARFVSVPSFLSPFSLQFRFRVSPIYSFVVHFLHLNFT
ncbi:hypothetical protein VNO78_27110 [Psophocarpus tetragonolobus]|uniref:Uncharacterized protein n=1 Tax=Psophocarpus tetragonolobus TaxID=3891 RepID=A0AAN9XBQ9_PSOTE